MRTGWMVMFVAGCAARTPAPLPVPDNPRMVTVDGAFDCPANETAYNVCDGSEGCIRTQAGECRATVHFCEEVVPVTASYPHRYAPAGSTLWPAGEVPTFMVGDPCASVNPLCAFDTQEGICDGFSAVRECPATAEEAEQTQVFCTHPDQPQLRCEYPGIRYECGKPWRPMGGAAPPPGAHDTPVRWFSTPDYDFQGCPMTARAREAACEPLTTRNGECVAMDNRFSCPNGVWESERLPPRP